MSRIKYGVPGFHRISPDFPDFCPDFCGFLDFWVSPDFVIFRKKLIIQDLTPGL
jgi:hypothetical protein